MTTCRYFVPVVLASLLMAVPVAAAQTKKHSAPSSSNQPTESEVKQAAEEIAKAQADLVAAAKAYRESLEKLLVYQKQDVTTAEQSAEKRKALYAQNKISDLEVQESERMLSAAQVKVSETQAHIQESQDLISEAMAKDPVTEARKLLAEKKKQERTNRGRIYYVRFIIVGEITIYDYSGAIIGRVIKHRQQIKYDSRKYY